MTNLTKRSRIKIILIIILCLVLCLGIGSCSVGACSAGFYAPVPEAPSIPSAPSAPSAPDAPGATETPGASETSDAASTVDSTEPSDASFNPEPAKLPASKNDGYTNGPVSTFPADGSFENLRVSWAAGSVWIGIVSDDQADGAIQIYERMRGNVPRDQMMDIESHGNTVEVLYNKPSQAWFGCGIIGSKHLLVLIPQSAAGCLESLTLEVASGESTIYGLDCSKIDISMASGKLKVSETAGSEFSIEASSGSADISGAFRNRIDISALSGNINFATLHTPNSASLEVASGNATLTLPENAGFTAQVDKASGSFNCDYETIQRGDAYICGDGRSSIDIDMASGNVTLKSA